MLDQVKEAAELRGAVARGHFGDDLAGGHVERGIEVRGAVAHVVVGVALGHAGEQRQHRAEWSSAWTWAFSSTHSATAASGGLR